MNPAKEVALNKSETSSDIWELFGKNNWTITRKKSETEIVISILVINSAKDLLTSLYSFKNSTGIKSKNIEVKK